ncbi:hypothetical protein F5X68DRAFT_233866 [Plectosphaerella plurivora]|uniref:EthD domain-containing protein n=1 Tax=Plectosphaerella plurivora TaxID=936078 RepID=A0A9P9A880_9PEZI|nr:hypothetical protein F5X68DRAFT_233866 [Plectosphaerella plurivora]
MTFQVALFAYRKSGSSPEVFKHHYETVHVPLVKKMSGSLFPLVHCRRYVSRPEKDLGAEVISGEASDIPFDAITEMRFESREAFYKFAALINEPSNAAKIEEDCRAFLDVSRAPTMVVIEDICETRRE